MLVPSRDSCTSLPLTTANVELDGVPVDCFLPSPPTVEMKRVFVADYPAPVYRRD